MDSGEPDQKINTGSLSFNVLLTFLPLAFGVPFQKAQPEDSKLRKPSDSEPFGSRTKELSIGPDLFLYFKRLSVFSIVETTMPLMTAICDGRDA